MVLGGRNNFSLAIFTALALMFSGVVWVWSQREFGFDNRKATGQPYLAPQETVRRFRVSEGWEITLFASEPDVINPIAFSIDERGRLWVLECYEYPKRTPPGKMPRDRIKILEDTDGDGRADKVIIWAEGKDFPLRFDLASGLEVGYGGVFLGAPPYLFFLQSRGRDERCNHYEILLKGFGSQDTHETLNTFQWGPDGRLYGLHGVFTTSEVEGKRFDAAVWRYNPRLKSFDIFAEGTSNPWGMDFDSEGNCFLVCCVIPHLFHIVPGGIYIKQGNKPSFHPYAYGRLREISDHLHHQESGWAHAGLIYLDGPSVPQHLRGSLLMGSIHGSSIKRDVLRRNGSSFIASHAPDFVLSGDRNVRPINLRWGPDGSIYWIDWHDQNPCHQAHPDSWDYSHGRIYRLAPKGLKLPRAKDMSALSVKYLADIAINDDNPYRYRTALRLLAERRRQRDPETIMELRRTAINPEGGLRSLRALWALYVCDALDTAVLHRLLGHPFGPVRAWAVRFLGEQPQWTETDLRVLTDLANAESDPRVRLELACALRRIRHPAGLTALQFLTLRKEDAQDPLISFMLWLAWEAHLSEMLHSSSENDSKLDNVLNWMAQHGESVILKQDIIPRAMRRLLAEQPDKFLPKCVDFILSCPVVEAKKAGLRGILEALRNRQVLPPPNWPKLREALTGCGDRDLARMHQELGILFRDQASLDALLAVLRKQRASQDELLLVLDNIALLHPAEALPLLKQHWQTCGSEVVQLALVRALSNYDEAEIAAWLIASWKQVPNSVRSEITKTLQKRKVWARALLEAVARKDIAATELNSNTVLAIRAFNDKQLNQLLEKLWGQVRETPADIEKKIQKYRAAMHQGRGDADRGRKVFEKHCAQCHRFRQLGHEVGPELDGAERSLDYLLINILDPNRVVGQPYFTRVILTKDGKVLTGVLAAEDAQSVTIRRENNVLETVQRNNIEEMKVETRSLMPENLDQNITEQELRDLISYLIAHPFLTEVYVCGPVRPDRARLEAWLQRKKRPVDDQKLHWQTPAIGPSGRIIVPAAKYDLAGHDVAYIYSEIETASKINTELRVGSRVPLQIWLDGELILRKDKPTDQAYPDELMVPVVLLPGRHHVLVEAVCLDHAGEVYIRFTDPDRKLQPVRALLNPQQ